MIENNLWEEERLLTSQLPGLEYSQYRDIIVQRGHKGDPRAGAPLLRRQAGGAGAVQPGEAKFPRETLKPLPEPKQAPGELERDCLQRHGGIGQRGMASN